MEPDHYRFWPPGLPREVSLPQTSLYANLEATASRFPDKTALIYYGTRTHVTAQFKRESMRWPVSCSDAPGSSAATACCCSCRTARSS